VLHRGVGSTARAARLARRVDKCPLWVNFSTRDELLPHEGSKSTRGEPCRARRDRRTPSMPPLTFARLKRRRLSERRRRVAAAAARMSSSAAAVMASASASLSKLIHAATARAGAARTRVSASKLSSTPSSGATSRNRPLAALQPAVGRVGARVAQREPLRVGEVEQRLRVRAGRRRLAHVRQRRARDDRAHPHDGRHRLERREPVEIVDLAAARLGQRRVDADLLIAGARVGERHDALGVAAPGHHLGEVQPPHDVGARRDLPTAGDEVERGPRS
jgi:hypothetical protein